MSDENTCHRCQGSGEIKYRITDPVTKQKTKYLIDPCPFCRGTGEPVTENIEEYNPHVTGSDCPDCHALSDRLASCQARIAAMEKEIKAILGLYGVGGP